MRDQDTRTPRKIRPMSDGAANVWSGVWERAAWPVGGDTGLGCERKMQEGCGIAWQIESGAITSSRTSVEQQQYHGSVWVNIITIILDVVTAHRTSGDRAQERALPCFQLWCGG